MIKNIYDKNNKKYWHKYYCDNCFGTINFGEILRNEKAAEKYIFDLCSDCFREFEEENNGSKRTTKTFRKNRQTTREML